MNGQVDFAHGPGRILALLLFCAIGALSAAARGAGVAMVTDLQGKATATSDGRSRDLTILSELEAGARVQLADDAKLVALYLDAGDEYVFKGPATIDFGPAQPTVLAGAKAERHGLPLGKGGKDIRIKPVGMTQGAVVMRGVRTEAGLQLLTPHRTRTLEARPEFRWQGLDPGLKYAFELVDETGRTVFETKVEGSSFRLPASVQLKEGVPYTWELSVRLPDGRKYSSSADFAVAAADLRAQADALRPAMPAPLSTRIAYAAWLDGMELRDEARKYWKSAATERPADARLKALAEQ